ncbi:MAG TPA: hypothetical protein VF820_00155, partial [Patescibacteria group bacterium]
GLHAFSHVPFGNPSCSKATAESELAASLKVAQKYKITFASFVFPCNLINYLDLLKKYKFIAYRGIQPNIPILRGFFHHILMALDFFAPIASPVATASIVNGLVNIPASFYFPSSRGNKKYIPKAARFYKAKLGIDAAIKQRKIFHMWTHPTDLTDNSENLLKEFFAILNYALAKQKQGMLEIKTMKQIAQETLYES